MAKHLDSSGLSYFWGKLKSAFNRATCWIPSGSDYDEYVSNKMVFSPGTGVDISPTLVNQGESNEFCHLTFDIDTDYIGKIYQNSGSYKISTAGIDTYTNGPSITLPAGTYIFVGVWNFNTGSSTGTRNVQAGFRTGSSGSLWGERSRVINGSYGVSLLDISAIRTLASSSTVYLVGSTSIVYTSNSTCYITAIRIG